MLRPFVVLVAFQFAGEALTRLAGLPVPGPVAGLALLAGASALAPGLYGEVEAVADLILRHLSLLFVPAGVGVLQHAGLLRQELWPIAAVLVGSTLITLVVTVLVFSSLAQPSADEKADTGAEARS
jgi:putative effector of murein hydrolase LrgA (UPF0299 family)